MIDFAPIFQTVYSHFTNAMGSADDTIRNPSKDFGYYPQFQFEAISSHKYTMNIYAQNIVPWSEAPFRHVFECEIICTLAADISDKSRQMKFKAGIAEFVKRLKDDLTLGDKITGILTEEIIIPVDEVTDNTKVNRVDVIIPIVFEV